MIARAVVALTFAVLCAACAGLSQPDLPEPAPRPRSLETPALVFPAIDSTTLALLGALLDRVLQDTTLLSALSPSNPRVYALFRQLEAAQESFAIALTTQDASGSTLHDRLMAMTARTDSLFRALEESNRQAPRP
jgi:hypothetical protein